MMRSCAPALAAAAAFLVPGCGGRGNPFDENAWRQALDEVVAAERSFAALASDSTVQHAFTVNIARDAILFRPGPVPGAEALAAQPMPDGLALLWEPAFADVSLAGDLGFTTGPWRSGPRGMDADSLPGAGQYLTVWRRTPDGFRFVLDAGIRHDPAGSSMPGQLETAEFAAGTGNRTEAEEAGRAPESLRIADQDLGAALGDNGVAAYRAYAVDRVRVLRDGSVPAFGLDALVMAAPPLPFRSGNAGAGASASGDLGYTWGHLWPAGQANEPLGSYVRIWRRQADGSWKMVLDLVTLLAG